MADINALLIQLFAGLSRGMVLFLLSAGLSLIFGVMNILNFAHATFWLLAGYITVTIYAYLAETFAPGFVLLVPAVIGATAIMVALGLLIERVLIRRMYDRELPEQLLLTFALVLILGDVIKLIWGVQNRRIFVPVTPMQAFGVFINPYYFFLIGAGFGWLATNGAAGGLVAQALRVGMLAAILGIAFCAGSDVDRAAIALTLTHPTTPFAVAAGRCAAAAVAAGLIVLASVTGAAALLDSPLAEVLRAAAAGVGAATATAGCAFLLVWVGGNALTGVLFVHVALVSVLSPVGLAHLTASPIIRAIGGTVLSVGPSLWRYRGLAYGDVLAWMHALAWTGGGVLLGAIMIGRRSR